MAALEINEIIERQWARAEALIVVPFLRDLAASEDVINSTLADLERETHCEAHAKLANIDSELLHAGLNQYRAKLQTLRVLLSEIFLDFPAPE